MRVNDEPRRRLTRSRGVVQLSTIARESARGTKPYQPVTLSPSPGCSDSCQASESGLSLCTAQQSINQSSSQAAIHAPTPSGTASSRPQLDPSPSTLYFHYLVLSATCALCGGLAHLIPDHCLFDRLAGTRWVQGWSALVSLAPIKDGLPAVASADNVRRLTS